jgi:hypothetical protein
MTKGSKKKKKRRIIQEKKINHSTASTTKRIRAHRPPKIKIKKIKHTK